MGIKVVEEGGGEDTATKKLTDKTLQTDIEPSPQACFDVLGALKDGRNISLMSLVDPKLNPDLSRYLLKQPNETAGVNDDDPTRPESMTIGEMRPGIYGQRENRTADRVKDGPQTDMMALPAYFKDMQEVFGRSNYFDLVRNHNQVISTPDGKTIAELGGNPTDRPEHDHDHSADSETVEAARQAIQQKPNEPTILFNFDSHSDMWTGPVKQGQESIAQWVNAVLKTNPNVNEVYWVLPQDFKDNKEIRDFYFEHKGEMPDYDTVFVTAPPDMTLYLDKGSGALLTKKPDNYSEEAYRTIQFHKRTLDELPDFAGKRTAVSIDLDFFDNRGYDTTMEAAVNYKGDEGFQKFVQTLKDRNIRPDFTTVSASPEYVRSEHARELLRFSSLVAEATAAKMDAVAVPAENQVYSVKPHDAIQANRADNQGLQLLYELFKTDSRSNTPNDSIDLNVDSPKLKAALEATRRVYGAENDEVAKQILQRLDKMDGNENGVVEFEAIEALLLRVCSQGRPEQRLKKDPTR